MVNKWDMASLKKPNGARQYTKLLRPWLEFANMARPLLRPQPWSRRNAPPPREDLAALKKFTSQRSGDFPGEPLHRALEVALQNGPTSELILRKIKDFAQGVIDILDFCADQPRAPVEQFGITAQGFVKVGIEAGSLRLEVLDPFGGFVEAINGVEINRIGRCPICERFFYRLRVDAKRRSDISTGGTGTKACSGACNATLRKRYWRSKEQQMLLKTAEMLRDGRSVHEIAKALRVSKERARHLAYKTRQARPQPQTKGGSR